MKSSSSLIILRASCQCGDEEIFPYFSKQQCCIHSNETCSAASHHFGTGVCSQGVKTPMTSPCENDDRSLRCHNSYQESQYIGDRAHYICPDTCVPMPDMCQGVSWCQNDVSECGEQLRCPEESKTFLTSPMTSGHFYCDNSVVNNGEYDLIRVGWRDSKCSGTSRKLYLSYCFDFGHFCSVANNPKYNSPSDQ